jgi:DDE domain
MHSEGIVTAILACGLAGGQVAKKMEKISCKGYRFPPEIIQQAIWLYVRFTLSFHDVEGLLAERGILVSYETIRGWVNHFGPMVAADLRKRRPKPHTTWHLDEVYLKIDGRMVYLLRGVDAEGEVLDVLVQSRRNKRAAIVAKRRWCLVLAAPHGIFNVQRHLTSARTHRAFRASATQTWHEVVAAV